MFLNWALGLRDLGCRVIWLELSDPATDPATLAVQITVLRFHLAGFGLDDDLVIAPSDLSLPVEERLAGAAADADLFLAIRYDVPAALLGLFRRTAMIDIDPGLLQVWVSSGDIVLPQFDLYFTTGETVGSDRGPIPNCAVEWHYSPPPVHLPSWPVQPPVPGAPWTTVTHWWGGEWLRLGEDVIDNNKRRSFLDYLELPTAVDVPLELAVRMGTHDRHEAVILAEHGWHVRDSWSISSTPDAYRRYIQGSRGEFSCAKASCMALQNAWVSDRTLCYLASGRPAVVQHTGPSAILPDGDGLFRFRDQADAARALTEAEADYDHHRRRARQLVEEHFGARVVVRGVLERAIQ